MEKRFAALRRQNQPCRDKTNCSDSFFFFLATTICRCKREYLRLWRQRSHFEAANLLGILHLKKNNNPQWVAADAEIKVQSGENSELKRSPSKAWSRSVYNHTCYAYCQGFLPCLFLPFRSIHLHFFQNLSRFLLCWLWLTHGSWVGPQNKRGHPAGCRFPC